MNRGHNLVRRILYKPPLHGGAGGTVADFPSQEDQLIPEVVGAGPVFLLSSDVALGDERWADAPLSSRTIHSAVLANRVPYPLWRDQAYLIATPVFLVVLFFFFENFATLLPANY